METRRKPGRPRSAEAHEAILSATLELLVERGFVALTMEAVAAASGTSKATVYRRWSSKKDLVVEALNSMAMGVVFAPPETGSARGDYVKLLSELSRVPGPRLAMLLPRMAAESIDHPALREVYFEKIVNPRRELLATALRDGIARGELRKDLDVEEAVDLLVGPLVYRLIITADPGTLKGMPERIWDALEPSLTASSARPKRRSSRR